MWSGWMWSGWMWSGWMWSGWMWRLQERGIEREDNCFGGAPGTADCIGGAPGTVDCFGGASGKALSSFSLEFSTYGRDTALEECRYGFECGHHVGWFRVEHGGAACTLVLVYVSIRLSETVSEFRSIERHRTPDTVQHSCALTHPRYALTF